VAEGATIIMQARSKPYFQKAWATPVAIAPDRLARSGRKGSIRTVDERLVLSDGSRTLDIRRVRDSHHAETFLVVYLPKERLLIEADSFSPGAPNSPPPPRPDPHNVNLIENLQAFDLPVERILPIHGRVVPVSDLYTAAGMTRAN
jgi:hypothetical protein